MWISDQISSNWSGVGLGYEGSMTDGKTRDIMHPTGIAKDPIVTQSALSLSPNQTFATFGGPLIVNACPTDDRH